MLGNLYCIFGALPTSDSEVTAALHGSLERRWAKTDQELMILSVFLNPFTRHLPFNLDVFPLIMFFHLTVRAYKRLLRQDPAGDIDFAAAFNDNYNNIGFFSKASMALDWHHQAYVRTVSLILCCGTTAESEQGVSPDLVSI
jgi:hypothetical protein